MAKIVLAPEAPDDLNSVSLANEVIEEFPFETDDPTVLGNATSHPWLAVEYDADQAEATYRESAVDPTTDPLSASNPDSHLPFDAAAIKEIEDAKRAQFEPVAVDGRTSRKHRLDHGSQADGQGHRCHACRPRPTRTRSGRLHRPHPRDGQPLRDGLQPRPWRLLRRLPASRATPEFYVRDASIGFWLFAALGADAPPARCRTSRTSSPRPTRCRTSRRGATSRTRCSSSTATARCRLADTISAEAGAPLTCVRGIQGLQATRLTADPSTAPAIRWRPGPVYNYNNATVTLGGSATALVRSFELTHREQRHAQQTDDVIPYDVVEGSARSASASTSSSRRSTSTTSSTTAARRHHDLARTSTRPRRRSPSPRREQLHRVQPAVHRLRGVPGRAGRWRRPHRRLGPRGRSARRSPVVTATVKNQVASY
jgi:hypothetical protein